jgi:hypothetical protein
LRGGEGRGDSATRELKLEKQGDKVLWVVIWRDLPSLVFNFDLQMSIECKTFSKSEIKNV